MNDNLTEVLANTGRGHVFLPHCCDGKVIVRIVSEANAYRNMIDGPVKVSESYHCKKCDRLLEPVSVAIKPVVPKPLKKAFTLIELLIVLAFVAIIGSMLISFKTGCRQSEGVAVGVIINMAERKGLWQGNLAQEAVSSAPKSIFTRNKTIGPKLIDLTGKRVKLRFKETWKHSYEVIKVDETLAAPPPQVEK